MNVLTITLGEKTYQAGRFPAYLAREIMRIQGQQNEIAKTRKELAKIQERLGEISEAVKTGGVAAEDYDTLLESAMKTSEAVLSIEEDVYDRLIWVICETYGKQFSADDIEKNMTRKQIADQIRMIANATNDIFAKN